jgi:hypothetical protein
MRHWIVLGTCLLLSGLLPRAFAGDDEKTAYKGHICDQDEYNRIVKAKNRTLEIQGGFDGILKDKWADTAKYTVGDTIHMSFHIGVAGADFKLNTKSFPAPVPVLTLIKDGKEYKQVAFTKGAC